MRNASPSDDVGQLANAGAGSVELDFLAVGAHDLATQALQALDGQHVDLGAGHADTQIAGRECARRGDAELAVVELDQCRRMDFLAGDLVDAVAEVDTLDFRALVDTAASAGHAAGMENVSGR